MQNPNLQGIFLPVDDESDYPALPVHGEIPGELRGTFYRNGPNPYFEPAGEYHLFDGDGMIHALTFGEGGARYRNRWIQSAGLGYERKAGRALYGGMANPQRPDPELIGHGSGAKNVANTNIVRHAGSLLCLWEGAAPTEISEDLATLGLHDYAGKLDGPMTAHPKLDPSNGELVFFGYSAVPPYLRVHTANARGELIRSVEIDLPQPVMIHDFAITRDHIVLFDAPAIFDFEAHGRGESILQWRPDLGTRIGVMPRDGGSDSIRWYETDPCYVFHFLNAWSDGSKVEVMGGRIAHLSIGLPTEENSGKNTDSSLSRFSIDLADGKTHWERVGDLPSDFYRVPDACVGARTRYGYAATFSTGIMDGGMFDSLVKYDFERGREVLASFGPGKIVGEPVFAPRGDGGDEDDGWLIAYLYDLAEDSSEVVVLDAKAIDETPVARIPLPRRVPFGFHGNWVPA
jgi:carotenoid cleavage dioxygenase-like enzyme